DSQTRRRRFTLSGSGRLAASRPAPERTQSPPAPIQGLARVVGSGDAAGFAAVLTRGGRVGGADCLAVGGGPVVAVGGRGRGNLDELGCQRHRAGERGEGVSDRAGEG